MRKKGWQVYRSYIDTRNHMVYDYWKDRCGLVNKKYAMKFLKIGDRKFKKIIEVYGLEKEIKKAPNGWTTTLYKLDDLRKIKEEMKEEN